jgi:hypothetical protein
MVNARRLGATVRVLAAVLVAVGAHDSRPAAHNRVTQMTLEEFE